MNTIIKKFDKTYGGYDYIEYIEEFKNFRTGCSRAHKGHYKGKAVVVNVTTSKELKDVRQQLESMGYIEDKN